MRRIGNWKASVRLAKTCVALAMSVLAVPALADVYDANDGGGSLGTLTISSGTLAINTGSNPPTMTDGGPINFAGEVEAGDGSGVAVFRFDSVSVTGSTIVTVVGTRPLAIVASGDVEWTAAGTIDISDGKAGGGAGGGLGAGGSGGGQGGAGGSTGGTGGAAASGGTGGTAGVAGAAGADGSAGSNGADGAAGTDGAAGAAGGAGGLGSGTTGANAANLGGTAGSAGAAGTFSGAVANGGSGNTTVITGGGGGAFANNTTATGGTAPSAAGSLDGGAASDGTPGGNATDGTAGGNATFGVAANTLDLVGGAAGGGGGGGGQGSGGQGGGKGGGGASGAGGGGGGGVLASNVCAGANTPPVPPAPTNGRGNDGGAGGAGGAGGNGGNGGTAAAGGSGTAGANGGGAILLAAQGLLQFSAGVDASAGVVAGAPGAASAAVSGSAGVTGAAGAAGGAQVTNGVTASWRTIDGSNYCTVVNTAVAAAGASGRTGGNGGNGGNGGQSGTSGAGAAGGLGTPGMVKLHGSVILASGASVDGNNGPGSADDQKGKLTLISNSSDASVAGTAAAATPSSSASEILVGRTGNPSLLNGASTWYPAGTNPKIGELNGGPDTEGVVSNGTTWNAAQVGADTPVLDDPRVDVVVLEEGTNGGVFDGYAQVFLINQMGKTLNGVTIDVGNGPLSIPGGSILSGETFTTTVATADLPDFEVDFARLGAELRQVTGTGIPGLESSVSGSATTYVSTTITLAADALEGLDPYAFTWQRNGTTFTPFSTNNPGVGQENALVQMSGIHLTGGLYKATVNDVTSDPSAETAEIQITVVANLGTPSVAPTNATKNVGDTHTLTATVTGGVLPLNYEWQLEQSTNVGTWYVIGSGGLPAVDALITGQGTNSLNINVNDEALLEGKYRVVVGDSGIFSNRISNQATLNITNNLGAATITNVEAYTGETAQLVQNVFGATKPYQVIWKKGSTTVATQIGTASQSQFILDLSPADVGDIGTYTTTVTSADAQGPINRTASVDVKALPTVTTPADASGYFGTTVNFNVTGSGGYGVLSYEWKIGGSPIIGAPNANAYARVLQPTDNGALISVTVSDEGGDTGVKTATSGDATITAGTAPVVTITSAGFRGYVDDTKPTQTVSVTGGLGALSYSWFVDGNNIASLSGVSVNGTNGDLTLPNESVTGTLTATVSDSIGAVDSTNSVEVEIVEHLDGVQVDDTTGGDGNNFSHPAIIQGEGLQPLSFEWTKDDGAKAFQPLVPAQNGPALVFTPLSFADAGTYQVTVSDDGTDGPFSDSFVLTVIEGVPVGGGLGLGALAVMSALGGALALRRRRK